MRIEVDGRHVDKPPYAQGLSDRGYIELMAYAAIGYGHYPGGEILSRVRRDPNYLDNLVGIVRNSSSEAGNFYISAFVSTIADEIAKRGQLVELIPSLNAVNLLSASTETAEDKTVATSSTTALESYSSPRPSGTFPELGVFLHKGFIVCRGNVEKVSGVRGGTLYIDGNVETLDQCNSGIIYINGDLKHLRSTEREIIVVSGKIHEYEQAAHYQGGLQTERMPSPFVFSPYPVDAIRSGRKIQIVGRDVGYDPSHKIPFQGVNVVDAQRLANWTPESTIVSTLELARERILGDIEKILDISQMAETPDQLARFYDKFIIGYVTGKRAGLYEAPNCIDAD